MPPFTADGKSLVSAGFDGAAIFWDPISTRQQAVIPWIRGIRTLFSHTFLAVAPDGNTLAAGLYDEVSVFTLQNRGSAE